MLIIRVGFGAILVFAVAAVGPAADQVPSFDGITIIELGDPAAAVAIAGEHSDSNKYIVTFVSAQGTYAAVTGSQSKRHCVSWAVPGSYTGNSISFGLPASTNTIRNVQPRVCEPFTLSYINAQTIRVSTQGTPVFSRERRVVSHIPLVGIDWGQTVFGRYTVLDARLGPVSNATAGVNNAAEIYRVGGDKLKVSSLGVNKSIEWRVSSHPERANHTIYATIADKSVTGWPWDAVYAARASEKLPRQSLAQAFNDAIETRFGAPSFVVGGGLRDLTRVWTFDLNGRQLGPTAEIGDTCHATINEWITKELSTYVSDLGPWGCLLVARLTTKGDRLDRSYGSANEVDGRQGDYAVVGRVRGYRQEVVSGYALALNHFLGLRLPEMRKMQASLEQTEAMKPRL